jgi:hypothetical protein
MQHKICTKQHPKNFYQNQKMDTNTNLEIALLEKITLPHISFPQNTIYQKAVLAFHILSLKENEVLLSGTASFSYASIIAGISENNIEYIGKNAPQNYKTELFDAIQKNYIVKEVSEIAQAMDKDLGENVTQNQQRVKNVMRYIQDNQIAFQF